MQNESNNARQLTKFIDVNRAYERWLRKKCDVIEEDLQEKHDRMLRSPFDFLRATYFRWAGSIEHLCADLCDAPAVLAVGDVHIENYGIWRDAEGRSIWGINDFDDATVMPYPWDLVRLMTSVRLAPNSKLNVTDAAQALLTGYRVGLTDPAPFVLDYGNDWLRDRLDGSMKSASAFWEEIEACPDVMPPSAVRKGLKRSLWKTARILRFASRRKGVGSLGRPRFLVLAEWEGAHIVREAKALVPSAWNWAHASDIKRIRFMDLSAGSFRSPDPFVHVRGRFIYKRLMAGTGKIDLKEIEKPGLVRRLVTAMGRDLGAIHAISKRRRKVISDLDRRESGWLERASDIAESFIRQDFESLANDPFTFRDP